MDIPVLNDFDFQGKKVLVRVDLDVPIENGKVVDDSRIVECLPTISYLLEHKAKVILLGHIGRPKGKIVEELKMTPVRQRLIELLGEKNFTLLENLRFDPREESNDLEFVKELAGLGDFYVNESFATSHRSHASIVGIPKFLPHCTGLHFASEVENLSKVLENPKKPVVFVIGGAKPETKLPYIADFARMADAVLVGGTLAQKSKIKDQNLNQNSKIVIFADLTSNGFDINEESIERFVEIIKNAGTVVWNGPMGKYEGPEGEEGTRRVGEAIANSTAFKVVGGGDTIAALKKFNLIAKMNYVSTAGGAMLEFLSKGSLLGIDVLK